MSLKQLPNGRWLARYTPTRNTEFKQVCDSWTEAKRQENEWKQKYFQKSKGRAARSARLTLQRFIEEQYVPRYGFNYGRNLPRVQTYLTTIGNAFSHKPLVKLEFEDLELWLDQEGQKRKWKQATRNYYVALLKKVFKKAVQWRFVSQSPAAYLEKPTPGNERDRYATFEELDEIWKHAPDRLKRTLVGLLNSGIRKGRIEEMDWSQLNMQTRIGKVPNEKGKPYTFYINDALYEELLHVPVQARTGRVFDTTNLRKDWEKTRQAAGCPDLWIHDLRRTFGTWSTERTKDLNKTQRALGHASSKMTERYRIVIDKSVIEAFQSVSFKPSKKSDKSLTEGLNQTPPDSPGLPFS